MVDVNVNDELANRLGLTDASVSQTLSGAFDGAAVSTFWEGDRAGHHQAAAGPGLPLEFRGHREHLRQLGTDPCQGPAPRGCNLGARVADQQDRPQKRRSYLDDPCLRRSLGYYASKILEQAMPQIKALELPAGYRIYYGGEKDNQDETFPQMLGALGISLVAIFLVLLVQFRNISEPLVVMASIPLTLFGAMFGLLVTHNPFGFTAFMGVISLCGIVVRNGIILVDYCNERIAEGAPLEQAATGSRGAPAAADLPYHHGCRRGYGPHDPLRVKPLEPAGERYGIRPHLLDVLHASGRSSTSSWQSNPAPQRMRPASTELPSPWRSWRVFFFAAGREASAEPVKHSLTLSQAVELALKQNSVLKIARMQGDGKRSEDSVGAVPIFPAPFQRHKVFGFVGQATSHHSGGQPGKCRR